MPKSSLFWMNSDLATQLLRSTSNENNATSNNIGKKNYSNFSLSVTLDASHILLWPQSWQKKPLHYGWVFGSLFFTEIVVKQLYFSLQWVFRLLSPHFITPRTQKKKHKHLWKCTVHKIVFEEMRISLDHYSIRCHTKLTDNN